MIIEKLSDLDYYKLTMCYLAWKHHNEVVVRYEFKNRKTNIRLADIIPEERLVGEIKLIQDLSYTEEELNFIQSKISDTDFIEFLRNLKLPEVTVEVVDGQYKIETVALWQEAILWETLILSLVSELFYQYRYTDHYKLIQHASGQNMVKYSVLSNKPELKFTDFGTRRRFSSHWQKDVVSIMKSLPNFEGTSNVKLAMELDLPLVGTNAHEMYMIASGMWREQLRDSWDMILDDWEDLHPDKLIVLPDTFGTKHFFTDFGKERAEKWLGVRHDSGDPFIFGEKVIEWYNSMGINPAEKVIVFSDGLTLDKMVSLFDRFNGRIKISFGWGTHLTNDTGVEKLSIVMKAVEVISMNGISLNNKLVKLSDNLNKAVGSKEDIELYKKEFEYVNNNREDTVV